MRTKIPLIILNPANGNAEAGAEVAILTRADQLPADVHDAEVGGAVMTQPLISDFSGRVAGWVERGAYTAIITPETRPQYPEHFDSTPGSDSSIDTAWLGFVPISAAAVAAAIATGGLQGRTVVNFVTAAVLASAAQEATTIPMYRGWRIIRVTTDRAARLRLYSSLAARDADVARSINVDPIDYPTTGSNPNHGCMLEVVTDATHLDIDVAPNVIGDESSGSDNIPAIITNLSGGAHTVAVTINYQRIEP
jgi:hypothetical protein